jgi:hypothetical protein
MNPNFLVTTSTEGLQPLGSTPQRSYELVSGTLGSRLGREYAALFGEPVATEHGDRIDWYAPVAGAVRPLSELSDTDQRQLRDQLGKLIGDIQTEADLLGTSNNADDNRLSEALKNAIEVPDEAMIYGVQNTDGVWQPVLVHWAWVRNEQAAVRGVLTGMVARETPLGQGPGVEHPRGRSRVWWWLLLLGWLLLAAILAAILYLLIAPCGVSWDGQKRFALRYCPAQQVGFKGAFEDARILGDENARLLRELALANRSCQPRIPILPSTPLKAPGIPVPAFPVAPQDQTKTDADRSEVEKRITERGAKLGALNFVLEWASKDDIDLYVTCPAGDTISYKTRAACGGRYDLDANVVKSEAVGNPAENIVFENAAKGLYKVRAHLRGERTSGTKTVTLHVLRKNGQSQSYTGTLGPGQSDWTVNISISR